ncbi:MAG: MaoC family dehydratase [Chloroflexi bacterium]|nr:MaoC family dehydratase [Chloroflexota bacterium]MDA1175357.1 MaoC family dehydratase [Chloroflexota bacterium]
MDHLDISVGQTASRELTVTPEMIESYAQITGDRNPLHFDAAFTAKTRFGRLMAQGGIATGLLHALVAMDMPGAGTVFTKQAWTFPRPVYIGDTITAEATVLSVNPRRPMADLAFTVTNQDGEEVLKGEATVFQATPEE